MILVCGSLHLDIVVEAPHLPRLDETVTGSGVSYQFGGKGGNQAVAAARMGAVVAMAGRVGDDSFAATLLGTLTASGVNIAQVQHGTGPSGMSVAIMDPTGGYGAVIASGANFAIDPKALHLPADTSVVVLQNEIPEGVNLTVARAARAVGARVILNAAPARAVTAELLRLVDLLVVNRIEAEDMAGQGLPPLDAAQALATRGAAAVLVTLGGAGVVLWDGAAFAAPAHDVAVISTHGAGDAFLGALAAELARGSDLRRAVAFGQAAGALHVASPVAERGRITEQSVRALMGQTP